MNPVVKDGKKLKSGYTTGTCAAAAAKAAAMMIFEKTVIEYVKVKLPNASALELHLEVIHGMLFHDGASCAIMKDAGDDPDVTNHLKIFARVEKIPFGFVVDGGDGVGRVTKPGLKVRPGQAAINPVPMEMILNGLKEVKSQYHYEGGFKVIISVPGGALAAQKTFNPRLGIVGGISILGTTGIVEPMSESALIDTVKVQMDVYQKVNGLNLVLAPGNYGQDFVREVLHIHLDKSVKCSNFIGEALDYACFLDFQKILLVGHTGKLVKLAGGIMNTHSKIADCRMEILGCHLALAGGNKEQVQAVMACMTTDDAIGNIQQFGFLDEVKNSLCHSINHHIHQRLSKPIGVEFILFNNENQVFLMSQGAMKLAEEITL